MIRVRRTYTHARTHTRTHTHIFCCDGHMSQASAPLLPPSPPNPSAAPSDGWPCGATPHNNGVTGEWSARKRCVKGFTTMLTACSITLRTVSFPRLQARTPETMLLERGGCRRLTNLPP